MDSDSMTMQATLLNNNLPDSISYMYESNGVKNTMIQKHHPISNNQTLIINKQKFEFYGLMKILTFLKLKGFKLSDFQNQSKIYLKEFKSFIENEATVYLLLHIQIAVVSGRSVTHFDPALIYRISTTPKWNHRIVPGLVR